MQVRNWLLAGAGVAGIAAVATGIGVHVLRERERSSLESLTDVVFSPHDRDASGTVGLDGPLRADDERMFRNPVHASSDASYLTLLQAADMLGSHDRQATRDEVRGLLSLADTDRDGRLSTREQHRLTHEVQYTRDYGSFFPDKVTLAEVPAANAYTRDISDAFIDPPDWYEARYLLESYGVDRAS